MQDVKSRYRSALELYRTTDLSVRAICRHAQVSFGGFQSYIYRYHRELLFARYGIAISPEDAVKARLRKPSGQTAAARAKYKDAIQACDDTAYIEFNVSQIARLFGLSPSALANQLRNHYPEILERREKERCRLGVNDNLHRGVKPWCREQYAEAVEHLRTSDDSIRETADLYTLSYSGLREHLLYYYKELIRERADKRRQAKTNKTRGELTGSGRRHEPAPRSVEKYREAIRLYRTTAMTQKQICAATGVSAAGLCHHLRIWNKDLVLEHSDVDRRRESDTLSGRKRYLKSTAAKYAEAIVRLKTGGKSTAKVAKEFGLHPETFRMYLHEHEPELAAALGMTQLASGKRVLVRSAERYGEAVRLYETTAEPLKSIAKRLGLHYNSVGGFIRRNRPDAIKVHNRLVEQEKSRQVAEKALRQKKTYAKAVTLVQQNEAGEKERILQVLRLVGGNKRNAAILLGISKSTLYNKLNAYNLINED